MSMANVFNKLSTSIIPKIANKVFPDLLTISRATQVSDGGGSSTQTIAVVFDDVNCIYEPLNDSVKYFVADSINSKQKYVITIPRNQNGNLISIKTDDLITVKARGNEPAKNFKLLGVKNDSSVILEIVADLIDEI